MKEFLLIPQIGVLRFFNSWGVSTLQNLPFYQTRLDLNPTFPFPYPQTKYIVNGKISSPQPTHLKFETFHYATEINPIINHSIIYMKQIKKGLK